MLHFLSEIALVYGHCIEMRSFLQNGDLRRWCVVDSELILEMDPAPSERILLVETDVRIL